MISKPYLFSAGGPINDGLKLLIDDGARDRGPDSLTVVPSAAACVGVNGFVGTGASSFATIGTVADLTFPQNVGVLTVAAWVLAGSATDPLYVLSSRYGKNANGFTFGWFSSTNKWGCHAYRLGDSANEVFYNYAPTGAPVVGTWECIVGQYDFPTGTGTWAINGVLAPAASENKYTLATGDAASAVQLGRSSTGVYANARFRGVRLWNRVLSASEVRYLYETERPAFYR